ncbi:hypothetical protein Dimus_020578 [Dionaea muscipula]
MLGCCHVYRGSRPCLANPMLGLGLVLKSTVACSGYYHASSWLLVVHAYREDELVIAGEVSTLAELGLLGYTQRLWVEREELGLLGRLVLCPELGLGELLPHNPQRLGWKVRIKLKPRSLGEPSQSHPETTTLCVVDATSNPGALPGGGDIVPLELSNDESPLKSSMRLAGLWDVNMKPSLSSLQWAGIVSGSPDFSCPELELSSSSFLSIGGGGSVRFHGPDDDDVGSYVGSEEAELRTPPLQDLTGIPSLDETGMTKGRRLQLPFAAFVRGGRGRRGTEGRGCPDSPDRARVNTCDFDDRDWRNSCDAEDRHPKPPSVELSREKEVAIDFPWKSQKRRQLTGPIDFQDPIGGRESVVPLGGSACGSSSSMTLTSYAKERFKYEMVEGR